MKTIIDEWTGCYPSKWKGVIVPEAMAHPAKYSSRLIRRIYEHLKAEGWVEPGDNVLDPFGGVALGALDAMRLGLNWYGIELELRFAGLGMVNILTWNNKFGDMPGWGTARLFPGDSRRLLEVIGGKVQASVSSPPYAEKRNPASGPSNMDDMGRDYHGDGGYSRIAASVSSPPYEGTDVNYRKNGLKEDGKTYERPYMEGQEDHYGSTPGQLGGMKAEGFEAAVSSPPYNPPMSQDHNGTRGGTRGTTPSEPGAFVKYGNTPGQLEGMGMEGFDAAIGSPPYSAMQVEKNAKSIDRAKQYDAYRKSGGGQTFEQFCHTQDIHSQGYGNSDGQLSSMKDGSFDAAVSSPPFNQNTSNAVHGQSKGFHSYDENESKSRMKRDYILPESEGNLGNMGMEGFDAAVSSPPYAETPVTAGKVGNATMERWGQGKSLSDHADYGGTEGQLGGADDFWLAARAIVEQVYAALTPGGHAVWVVKDYVKAKRIVPFCDQWRQLCEAVGFVTLHEHHASLIRNKRTQHLLEGGTVTLQSESKSFFRRLAEKNGSPRIDHETVFCMVKL